MKYLILFLCVAGVLTGCKKPDAPPPAPPKVEVVSIVVSNVPIYREWVGTLEGEVNATISAQVTGYLLNRLYREGSVVTNGQVLFQIDPAPFQATLSKAKADLVEAEAHKVKTAQDVARYTPLAKLQAISQQELDDAIQADKAAAGQVASAQAAIESAVLNLGFTTIRSPVDGIAGLASAAAQVGNLIGPTTGSLTTVSQINPMRVYFSVSQQMMTEVMERLVAEGKQIYNGDGPQLDLVLASGTVYPLKGKVRFSNNQVDVKTGTIRVVGEFQNPQSLLVPGMFTRVRALVGTEKDALLVPQRAVTDLQGRYLVAVVGSDNKVSIKPVTVGERIGTDWIITGDIRAGDRVVAEGVQKVQEGLVVDPTNFQGTSTPKAAAPAAATPQPKKP